MIVPQQGTQPIGVMPPDFDTDYVEATVKPWFAGGLYVGEVPSLPMIDLALSKENASGPIWGMLYDGWAPNPEEEGVTVFLQGYEDRGSHNERKKIYMSATTPDLYAAQYQPKITRFIDQLFVHANAGTPLMHHYLALYFDLYWNLHLGVSGDAIPPDVQQIGVSFNTALAYYFPTRDIFYEHFMRTRELREPLKTWIDGRVQAILDGEVPDPEQTFVHYWLKNAGDGENFRRKDIVFECFHNFVAFSQWGKTIFNIMARLQVDQGDESIRSWFARTMTNGPDDLDSGAFTPLDRFVMELFRVISPNGGSLSTLGARRELLGTANRFIVTPHPAASQDSRHWSNPGEFDPDRYKAAPTSVDNGEATCQAAGLARCPFSHESLPVQDGRKAEMTNSGYGAVYTVVDGTAYPVVDAAGYAPFGFGYRRCAGERFTMEVIKDLLRTVWKGGIEFVTLDLEHPEKLPLGPGTIIDDTIAFRRTG
jgi:cytochrome P450